MKNDEVFEPPTIERHEDCGHSVLLCPRCKVDHGLHVVDVSVITRDDVTKNPDGPGQVVLVGEYGTLGHRVSEAEHLDDMPSGNYTEIGFRCRACDPDGAAPIMYLRIRSDEGTEMSWHPDDVEDEETVDETPPTVEGLPN